MTEVTPPRHASRRSRVLTIALPVGIAVTAVGALWALADVPAAAEPVGPPMPAVAAALPGVDLASVDAADPCADPLVTDALAAGNDEGVVVAFGGGAAFREAVTVGNAPCISLADPARAWVVVNKVDPMNPVDYEPGPLSVPALQKTSPSKSVRTDATAALEAMAAELHDAGAGVLGMNNGYRSYWLQTRVHASHVSSRGQAGADKVSARPGFSEHQTGLSMDVVSCGQGCSEIGEFGGTPESNWVAEHAWKHGFIVRYEEGEIGTTGYVPEPWHLRYIGPSLAEAYHEGGYRTLEEFFALPAAPDYSH
ncbi:MAG TPA: peptidase M15 [Microbacterium sp.]|nr:peptidase M15 [Microbacterium sp.]